MTIAAADAFFGIFGLRRVEAMASGSDKRNPMQPIIVDKHGVKRFKANAIVKAIVDADPMILTRMHFPNYTDDDRQQFLQLIGYSVGGFSEWGCVSDEVYAAAEKLAEATS